MQNMFYYAKIYTEKVDVKFQRPNTDLALPGRPQGRPAVAPTACPGHSAILFLWQSHSACDLSSQQLPQLEIAASASCNSFIRLVHFDFQSLH